MTNMPNVPTWAKLIIGFAFIFIYFYLHEYTHQTLYSYEGIDSNIGLNLKGFYTQTTNIDIENQPSKELIMAQYMIDVIGYSIFPIYLLLIIIFLKK